MMTHKSWQLGAPGTLLYLVYDSLRTRLNRALVRYLVEVAIQHDRSKVLEAGSGSAFASSLFAQDSRVCLSVAMDIDIEALREARRRDPKLSVVVADLYELPFAADVFDLVWNSSTLEHLTNTCAALREMQRVTRRGEYIFVGVPYVYGPLGLQQWIAKTRAGMWIGQVFDGNTLHSTLSGLGLHVTELHTYFFRFFVGVLARKP